MALADIPTRDALDGAAQLARLRSYLKDPVTGSERFTDDFLIALLVIKDKFQVWRLLLDIPELTDDEVAQKLDPVVPWSYDPDNPLGYVNTIRSMIGDISETDLSYTDYDICKLLEVMPAKRIVQAIKTNEVSGSTLPSDVNHPLRVLRELLGDTTDPFEYTDQDLLGALLSRYLNPYGFVMEIINTSKGRSSVSQSQQISGEFAAIDGISFSASELQAGVDQSSESDLNSLLNSLQNSVYYKNLQYNFYSDGSPSGDEISGGWYAV